MQRIILFAVETILCSGIFMLMYRLLLSQKAGYLFCRLYLICGLMVSAIIPMFNVPVYFNSNELPLTSVISRPVFDAEVHEGMASEIAPQEIQIGKAVNTTKPVQKQKKILGEVLLIIYLAGIAVSFAFLARTFMVISRLKRKSSITIDNDIILAENEAITSPFSFLHTVYLGVGYESTERNQILSHEASHIHNGHTKEKILMSVIRSFLWFNPFAWRAEKRLEEVQEWQADNDALARGYDLEDYQNTIIKMLFGVSPATTSGFNNSFTKNRLLHMRTKESHRSDKSLIFATLLMVVVCFGLFGCKPSVRAGKSSSVDNYNKEDIIQLLESDDRLFIYADMIPDGISSDNESNFHYSFIEYIKMEHFVENGGIEVYSSHDQDVVFPCIIAVNGYEFVKSAKSSELNWVDDDTWIYIGNKKSTYNDFLSLNKNKYIGIAYYKAHEEGHPSLVYVFDDISNCGDTYNYSVMIDYHGANLPDYEIISAWSLDQDRNIIQSDFRSVAEPELKYAVDGKLTNFESFENANGMKVVTRNDEAENRFGTGIKAVAETISDGHGFKLSLEKEADDIVFFIDNQQVSLDDIVRNIKECMGNICQ